MNVIEMVTELALECDCTVFISCPHEFEEHNMRFQKCLDSCGPGLRFSAIS